MDGISIETGTAYPDSWGDGQMHTERINRLSDKEAIEGVISVGEYLDRTITRDQEITVLAGTITYHQEGIDKPVAFAQGETFKLYKGRKYSFVCKEPLVFSCKFC